MSQSPSFIRRNVRRPCLAALLLVLLAVSGCSTAGPFVTNISSDGNGGLVIEKSYVHYNWWTSTISNVDQTSTTIRLTDLPRR